MVQPAGGVNAEDVRTVSFEKPPLGKRGYDKKSVDDFLQLVARRLEGRGLLSEEDVRAVRFPRPPFGRRGYSEHEVDGFLGEVTAAIAALPNG